MKRIILVIAAVMQSILLLGHYCVYATIVFFFLRGNDAASLAASIIFFALALSFVPALLLSSRYDAKPVRILYASAVTWLGSMYFWTAASLFLWISYDIASIFKISMNWTPYASAVFVAALCAALGALANGWKIRRTEVFVDIEHLPAQWTGKKAVWASDLHIGHIRGRRFARTAVKTINAEKPDIIFIGGDLFDGVKDDYAKVASWFSHLKAPLGVYFITGNHEEFSDPEKYLSELRKAGMHILQDEKKEIDGMQIVGVDYHTATDAGVFASNLSRLIDPHRPSILLKHVPDRLDAAEKAGVSLQISGHTHKAQMWPMNYAARRLFKGYEYGLRRYGNMQQLTSSGTGTWGPPFRLGTRSEIVVITFA